MSSVALPPLPAGLEYCVVARRNDSLGRRPRWQVFGALAAVSLALAAVFAVVGAWPVLPYSVLEIVVLGCAFYYVERRAEDWERLTIAGDRVVVEQAAGGKRQRHEFNRYWLRVEVDPARFGRSPQVMLRSGHDAWVFGSALPVAERLAVAQELRRLTGAW
jgi:Integral membrane protein